LPGASYGGEPWCKVTATATGRGGQQQPLMTRRLAKLRIAPHPLAFARRESANRFGRVVRAVPVLQVPVKLAVLPASLWSKNGRARG